MVSGLHRAQEMMVVPLGESQTLSAAAFLRSEEARDLDQPFLVQQKAPLPHQRS